MFLHKMIMMMIFLSDNLKDKTCGCLFCDFCFSLSGAVADLHRIPGAEAGETTAC